MCPACLTATALGLASATSTGGLAALVVKKLRAKAGAKKVDAKPKPTVETGNAAQ